MVQVQQKGTKDYELFAVALLTALVYNQDGPIQYCQDQLRSHLCNCFVRQNLYLFLWFDPTYKSTCKLAIVLLYH